jgi:hypothetical protein
VEIFPAGNEDDDDNPDYPTPFVIAPDSIFPKPICESRPLSYGASCGTQWYREFVSAARLNRRERRSSAAGRNPSHHDTRGPSRTVSNYLAWYFHVRERDNQMMEAYNPNPSANAAAGPNGSVPVEMHLLQGCCREAERADLVAVGLDQLRSALPEAFHGHLVGLTEEIRGSSRLLRDLADRSQVHMARIPIVLNYLNVVLPCLCRSLRDITTHYEDKTLSREIRWRKMYHKMTEEAGGLPLPQRFVLYNHFLSLLKLLLTR